MDRESANFKDTNKEQSVSGTWKWHPLALKSPRTLHQAVAIDDHRVVVSGGINDRFQTLKSAEIYDFWQNSVISLPDLLLIRYFHSSVVCDDQVFVIGGRSNSANIDGADGMTDKSLKSVEYFNMKLDMNGTSRKRLHKWKRVADMGTSRFDFASSVTHDNKYIYVLGGKSIVDSKIRNHNGNMNSEKRVELLSSVERYDMINDKWEIVASMKHARAGHHSVIVGHSIFVFGGFTCARNTQLGDDNKVELARTIEIFDTLSQTWKCGPPLPFTFSNLVAIVPFQKWIIIMGGQQSRSSDTSYLFFNSITHDWFVNQKLNDLVTKRNEHAQVVLDKKILVLGGLDTKGKILRSIEFTNIEDLVADENDEDQNSVERNLIHEQSDTGKNEESYLNISIDATLNEVELSLLITELEEDFNEAFVQLGGDCSTSWLEEEDFNKGSSKILKGYDVAKEEGIEDLKESGVSMLVQNENSNESISTEKCNDNHKTFLQDNPIHEEFIDTDEEEKSSESDQPPKDLKLSLISLDEPFHTHDESLKAVKGEQVIPMWKLGTVGFVVIFLFCAVTVMKSFWKDMNNEFKLTAIKKASLSQHTVEISSFSSGRINILVGNFTSFEIDESVLQCRPNRWVGQSNSTKLHMNQVEENTLFLQKKNLNKRGKNSGALGDRLSLTSNVSDCCRLDVDLVVMKKHGFVTISNDIYPVNSGDIKFSMQLTKQKTSRLYNNNDSMTFDTMHIHVMWSIKNGIVSIIDQNHFFSVEMKNSIDPLETIYEESEKEVKPSEKLDIHSLKLHQKLLFSTKNKSTRMVWYSYFSRVKRRTIGIFSDWDWYHVFQVTRDRNAFPIRLLLSCKEKLKKMLQIFSSYTTIRPQHWQLYKVLHSVQIRNVLKRSPIETLYKLSREQSIYTIDDFCEALATRRFDLILKKDYLHQWRGIATPRTIKKILKPLCKCRNKRHHSPEMECSLTLVN